ncbi:MAG: MBL fold metallo-hydrolase [Treponema sp.]|jgi:glyoxylase-like metal-dependent hydrolase (beta-lactamase superfamily II)|nr:MBL fold metallo-hydrolase [Treponema sp.]
MKIYMHYCSYGFSNCYILGTDIANEDSPRDAVVIDPGNMEKPMLDFIEKHRYRLWGVLITHDHLNHVHGLRTLKRVYDVNIYAVNSLVRGHKTCVIRDGDILTLGAIVITVITVPGHSPDSVMFKINHTLFTGDVLTAGLLGTTVSSYGEKIQMNTLRSKVLSLPGNFILLPGHGPPSSLDAERQYNAGIQGYEKNTSQRSRFKLEFPEL